MHNFKEKRKITGGKLAASLTGVMRFCMSAVCLAFAMGEAFMLQANADTTLIWNGADGAAWEGQNWLDGEISFH